MKKAPWLISFFIFFGILDTSYLTYEYIIQAIPQCWVHFPFIDCGKVLQSKYSTFFDVPLVFIGLVYYTTLALLWIWIQLNPARFLRYLLLSIIGPGFIYSLVLLSLQLFVIKAICLYCVLSVVITITLFFSFLYYFSFESKKMLLYTGAFLYQYLIKRFLFKLNPELVHQSAVKAGEMMGNRKIIKVISSSICEIKTDLLPQTFNGIHFSTPIGLAAGFDYEGRLTQILPSLGFGFQTVGTITQKAYEGNPAPILGRLPQSKSLMVNKGFKNLGAAVMVEKLSPLIFEKPVGISIGRSNSLELKTQMESVKDIIATFINFENSMVRHSYYELNISCPNLFGEITFYPPSNLEELLQEVDKLRLSRPVYIKMPIEKTDKEVLEMLEVISRHSPAGIIIGNLQKDRSNPVLVKSEVAQFKTGNFSGKPTYQRSNELIRLTYKYYKDRFLIIGCGGVFDATDAYRKIMLGASLIQLITGMIFQGPQLVAQINSDLHEYFEKDGFSHISEAVGVACCEVGH